MELKNEHLVLLISRPRDKVIRAYSPTWDKLSMSKSNKTILVAESLSREWFILSAKYHLLPGDSVLEASDLSLATLNEESRIQWAKEVFELLCKRITKTDKIVIIADRDYYAKLADMLADAGYSVSLPFDGRDEYEQGRWIDDIASNADRLHHVSRFYSLLNEIKCNIGLRKFKECHGKMKLPQKGVYFLFDDNEFSLLNCAIPRVVRIGTHGVSIGSKSTLWERLKTHKGTSEGGGSHRSSVFRLHIGNAIIERSNGSIVLPTWGVGGNADRIVRDKESFLEHLVSQYISNIGLLWISVNDPSSSDSDRAYIEQNAIALLTGPSGPVDYPTAKWLGNYSISREIKKSGMWNINHVTSLYDERFLDIFEEYVNLTLKGDDSLRESMAPSDWKHKLKTRTQNGFRQLCFLGVQDD